eukprot:symbB.v1.2.018193.t1/scaffold1442.1/size120416/3
MKGRGKGRGRKTEPKPPNVEGEVPGLLGKRTSCPWINSQIIQASKEDLAPYSVPSRASISMKEISTQCFNASDNQDNGIQRILGVVEMCINDMNLVNLSTSLHRLAKLKYYEATRVVIPLSNQTILVGAYARITELVRIRNIVW